MDQFAVIMDYVIGTMSGDDWERVRSIYLEGIRTGHATFELEAPSWDRWDAGHLKDCRLVVRDGNGVIGWAGPGRRLSHRELAAVDRVHSYFVDRVNVHGNWPAAL